MIELHSPRAETWAPEHNRKEDSNHWCLLHDPLGPSLYFNFPQMQTCKPKDFFHKYSSKNFYTCIHSFKHYLENIFLTSFHVPTIYFPFPLLST